MNASDILKLNSSGFMQVGIAALKKLIYTLVKYKEENAVLLKKIEDANIDIENLRAENKELRNIAFRCQIVTAIKLDV